jgi:hypothetical protein
MAREKLLRPSHVLAAWAVLVLSVFALRGDLRLAAPATATVAEQPPVPTAGPVVVRAESATRRVVRPAHSCKGRVVDAMGFLVVGAEVLIADRALVRTDADGAFTVELPEGAPLDVLVRGKGLQPRRVRLVASSPDPLLVRLDPAAPWDEEPAALPAATSSLRGEGLVRTEQGQPLAGAWVTALGSEVWSRTDEIGRYVLPLPSPNVTLLVHQAEAPGEARGFQARSEPIDVGRTEGLVPLPEIVAVPASVIRGVVRDPRGMPVEGVPVQVRGEGIARLFETGPGGIFRLGGLQNGHYVVRPFAYRGALGRPQEVTVSGAIADCDLHLQAADERRLRLLDEQGSPVGRAYVTSTFAGERNSVAQTDDDGWTAVVVAAAETGAGTTFEVRTGASHEPVEVRRYEADNAALVVGMP